MFPPSQTGNRQQSDQISNNPRHVIPPQNYGNVVQTPKKKPHIVVLDDVGEIEYQLCEILELKNDFVPTFRKSTLVVHDKNGLSLFNRTTIKLKRKENSGSHAVENTVLRRISPHNNNNGRNENSEIIQAPNENVEQSHVSNENTPKNQIFMSPAKKENAVQKELFPAQNRPQGITRRMHPSNNQIKRTIQFPSIIPNEKNEKNSNVVMKKNVFPVNKGSPVVGLRSNGDDMKILSLPEVSSNVVTFIKPWELRDKVLFSSKIPSSMSAKRTYMLKIFTDRKKQFFLSLSNSSYRISHRLMSEKFIECLRETVITIRIEQSLKKKDVSSNGNSNKNIGNNENTSFLIIKESSASSKTNNVGKLNVKWYSNFFKICDRVSTEEETFWKSYSRNGSNSIKIKESSKFKVKQLQGKLNMTTRRHLRKVPKEPQIHYRNNTFKRFPIVNAHGRNILQQPLLPLPLPPPPPPSLPPIHHTSDVGNNSVNVKTSIVDNVNIIQPRSNINNDIGAKNNGLKSIISHNKSQIQNDDVIEMFENIPEQTLGHFERGFELLEKNNESRMDDINQIIERNNNKNNINGNLNDNGKISGEKRMREDEVDSVFGGSPLKMRKFE